MSNSGYQIALFILQKISCSLSVIGSLMIVSQVVRNKFNRSKPQQRLILGLSLSDLCTSLGWIFTPLFMPSNSGAIWAIGNETTCNIQETRIRGVECSLHAVPWCLGLAAAITQLALKLFNPADWDCWIAPYPADCTSSHDVNKGGTDLTETDCIRGDNAEIYRWALFFAPLWAAILFCVTVMIIILKSVRDKERNSLKHSAQRYNQMSTTRASSEEATSVTTRLKSSMLVRTQKVKAQCFWYAGSFFLVWTFPTIARLIQLLGGTVHGVIFVLAGTFIGSQGFFNAMIYFRPRYNMIQKPGMLAKVWALICVTLFFCCYDESYTRGTRYDSDYMQYPNPVGSISNFTRLAKLASSAKGKVLGNDKASDNDEYEDNADADLGGRMESAEDDSMQDKAKRVSFRDNSAKISEEKIEEVIGSSV